MVNPILPFYEWYLTFYANLPDSFRTFLSLVWGLTLIFFLLNLFTRVIK